MSDILIDGIVARSDFQPYIRLFIDDKQVAQMSMAQARNVALDILQQCARAEADAMIRRFFIRQDFPEDACNALMLAFRDFRRQLDAQPIETTLVDPDNREKL